MSVEEQIRRRGERLLGLFFRAWAHELNNPVQAVLAGAELIELELGVPNASLAEIRERVRVQSREVATEVVRVSDGIARLHALCRAPAGIEGQVELGDLLAEANALWTPVSRHAGIATRFPEMPAGESPRWVALSSAAAVLILVDAMTAIWQGVVGCDELRLGLDDDFARSSVELDFTGGPLGQDELAERRPLWEALGVECELRPQQLVLRLPTSA